VNAAGLEDDTVLLYAYLNAVNETGFVNPIDQAITRAGKVRGLDASAYEKLDEIPYDFIRKRLSVLVRPRQTQGMEIRKTDHTCQHLLVTKGAIYNVLDACSQVETAPAAVSDLDASHLEKIESVFKQMSLKGFRVLGISYRFFDSAKRSISKEDENDSIFLGFLVLWDPIKDDALQSITTLEELGISLKMVSGDNRLIASYIGARL
jgi:P-type Mg2+ transporter